METRREHRGKGPDVVDRAVGERQEVCLGSSLAEAVWGADWRL